MPDKLFEYKGSVFILEQYGWSMNRSSYFIKGIHTAADELWLPNDYFGSLISPEYTLSKPDWSKRKVNVFKNVKKMYIPSGVISLKASNAMFPNLSEIIVDPANSSFMAKGSMLIKKGELCYVFAAGMRQSCIVPAEVQSIGYEAFKDTTCTQILFENPSVSIKYGAFDESAWIAQDVPYLMVGNLFYRCNTKEQSLVIPDNTKSFDEYAFANLRTNLTEIITPRQLTRTTMRSLDDKLKRYIITKPFNKFDIIGTQCLKSLEFIEFQVKSEKYCTIDGVLFSADKKRLLLYPPGKPDKIYHIPNGVVSIHVSAFQNCNYLEEVYMPKSVRKLGQGAFYHCEKLKIVHFSDSISDIPDTTDLMQNGVFEGCKNLSNDIQFPKNLRHIGSYAFFECGLKNLIIPDKVDYIGEYAFASYDFDRNGDLNTSLETCILPPSITYLGRGAIAGANEVSVTEGTARGLICALQAIPKSHSSGLIYNYMLWLASTIQMKRPDGSITYIDIPKNLNTESRMHIDVAWNQTEFDFDEYEECFEGITDTEEKQLFAFDLYSREGENCACADYLKRIASKLAESLVKKKNEIRLVELIQYRFLSENALRKLLKLTNEAAMNTASAYIMQAIPNKTKSKTLKL